MLLKQSTVKDASLQTEWTVCAPYAGSGEERFKKFTKQSSQCHCFSISAGAASKNSRVPHELAVRIVLQARVVPLWGFPLQ